MADDHHTPARASANVPTKTKLTTKFIESLQPPPKGGRLVVWDTEEPGLGIRVYDSGKRSFIVVKRIRGGDPIRYTVKPGFPTTTLAMAREKAIEVKRELANGVNPLERERQEDAAREQRKAEERDTSFATVAEAYISKKIIGANPDKPLLRAADMMAKGIRRDLLSQPWARKPVAQVTKSDIVGMIAGMVKDTKRRTRTKPGEWSQVAFRSFHYVRQILKWALKKDEYRLEVNICDRIDIGEEIGAAKPVPRDRVLVTTDDGAVGNDRELRLFWKATGRMDYPGGLMLRVLLLSACRLREIAHLEYGEISTVERAKFSGQIITIPAERMKGRNGKVGKHVIPITALMADVLASLPKFATPGRFVFSYSGGRRPMGGFDGLKEKVDSAILDVIREELGLPAGAEVPKEHLLPRWTFHDLRRTGRTLMSKAGVSKDISERVLAHKISGIQGVYDHWDFLPEKFDALKKLADEVNKIIGNNVVPLPKPQGRKQRAAG